MHAAVYDADGDECRSYNRRQCVDDEEQPRRRSAAQALPVQATDGTTLAHGDPAGMTAACSRRTGGELTGGGSGATNARRV